MISPSSPNLRHTLEAARLFAETSPYSRVRRYLGEILLPRTFEGNRSMIPAEGEEALGFCSATKPIPAIDTTRSIKPARIAIQAARIACAKLSSTRALSRSSRSLRILSSPPSIPNGALTFVVIYELTVVRAERCKGQPEAPADLKGRP